METNTHPAKHQVLPPIHKKNMETCHAIASLMVFASLCYLKLHNVYEFLETTQHVHTCPCARGCLFKHHYIAHVALMLFGISVSYKEQQEINPNALRWEHASIKELQTGPKGPVICVSTLISDFIWSLKVWWIHHELNVTLLHIMPTVTGGQKESIRLKLPTWIVGLLHHKLSEPFFEK